MILSRQFFNCKRPVHVCVSHGPRNAKYGVRDETKRGNDGSERSINIKPPIGNLLNACLRADKDFYGWLLFQLVVVGGG